MYFAWNVYFMVITESFMTCDIPDSLSIITL